MTDEKQRPSLQTGDDLVLLFPLTLHPDTEDSYSRAVSPHTHTEIKPVCSSQSSFSFFYLLTSHFQSSLGVSPRLTPPPNIPLFSLSPNLSLSIRPPFHCLGFSSPL